MIINWRGYDLGAVDADTAGLKIIERNSQRIAAWQESLGPRGIVRVADVHPKVHAFAGKDDMPVRHERGAYPIRWYLSASEIANLISLGD